MKKLLPLLTMIPMMTLYGNTPAMATPVRTNDSYSNDFGTKIYDNMYSSTTKFMIMGESVSGRHHITDAPCTISRGEEVGIMEQWINNDGVQTLHMMSIECVAYYQF